MSIVGGSPGFLEVLLKDAHAGVIIGATILKETKARITSRSTGSIICPRPGPMGTRGPEARPSASGLQPRSAWSGGVPTSRDEPSIGLHQRDNND